MAAEKEIIYAFTENCKGTIIGYSLYNSLNLTTQISKSIDVMSSNIEGYTKKIRNIKIDNVQLNYSENIINMIHCLEVLQNYYSIQDINNYSFLKYTKKIVNIYNDNDFKEVIEKINT